MDIKEKLEMQRITPQDLMWHLDATERELGEHYGASANAMNRITQIQSTVRVLLAERKQRDDLIEWISGGDVGISSKVLWAIAMGHPFESNCDVPHDPSDFHRCVKLLWILDEDEQKDVLEQAGKLYPNWLPLVEHWSELMELFEEELSTGTAPKLYKKMQELRDVI